MNAGSSRKLATTASLVAIVIGCICLVNGVQRIGRPFPGFLAAQNRIVVSIARADWPLSRSARILFAQIVAVEDRPVTRAEEVQAAVEAHSPGTPISYRFRRGADLFRDVIPSGRFGLSDFLAVHATYFVVGVCFSLAGLWVIRRLDPGPAPWSFFVLCQSVALLLFTGGDLYGPFWFTRVYFAAQCLLPAALFHFTCSYPDAVGRGSAWRLGGLSAPYAAAAVGAVVLPGVADDPALFLPLVYTVWLLIANALLLYLGRLAITSLNAQRAATRRHLRWAALGLVVSATGLGVILVIYPAIEGPISPVALVLPLMAFPLFTASALRREAVTGDEGAWRSVRQRLSFLFLGVVETAFLVGVAIFWLSTTWNQLLDDMALNHRRQVLVERLRFADHPAADDELVALAALGQTEDERAAVEAVQGGWEHGDVATARAAIGGLAQRYGEAGERLRERAQRINQLGASLVVALVVLGVAQAVIFVIAIRRWLIRPIDRLAATTAVIATGDLEHRAELDEGSAEFTVLAQSINAMAASLSQIRQRVEAEQEARRISAGSARDAERRRLARELHDGILQDLSAVKLRLEAVAKGGSVLPLEPVVGGLIDAITDLRGVVDDLRPPDLAHVSLREAIAAHARVLAQGRDVALTLDLAPTARVPEWASRDVYRIAQEAIANAVRHGAPHHLSVRMRAEGSNVVLEVADDGAGFEPAQVTMGTGITGMRERAAVIGATLDLLTAPGRGVTVRLTVPPPTSSIEEPS